MYRVDDVLTPEERLGAIQFGVITKLASAGIGPKAFVRMAKEAQVTSGPAISIDKLAVLSVMLGVPLGTISYALRTSLAPDRRKNRKLKASLDQFNDIVNQYKRQVADNEPETEMRSAPSFGYRGI